MEDIIKRIYDYSLEEIMGERFGTYSKYIIQDRAIPDVRDGLKLACGAEESKFIDISKNDINPYLNDQYKIK